MTDNQNTGFYSLPVLNKGFNNSGYNETGVMANIHLPKLELFKNIEKYKTDESGVQAIHFVNTTDPERRIESLQNAKFDISNADESRVTFDEENQVHIYHVLEEDIICMSHIGGNNNELQLVLTVEMKCKSSTLPSTQESLNKIINSAGKLYEISLQMQGKSALEVYEERVKFDIRFAAMTLNEKIMTVLLLTKTMGLVNAFSAAIIDDRINNSPITPNKD